jgi:hypothetical protein
MLLVVLLPTFIPVPIGIGAVTGGPSSRSSACRCC